MFAAESFNVVCGGKRTISDSLLVVLRVLVPEKMGVRLLGTPG